MKKFYTAKYDIVFKTIMVRNESILRKILESILHIKIDEITLLDKEISPDNFKGKTRILDMLVKSGKRVINVEVNSNKEYWHNYRNVSYIFGVYNNEVRRDREEDYKRLKLKEIISINLSYGMSEHKEIYDIYRVQNKKEETFIDNFKIIEINMDKIDKLWYTLCSEDRNNYKYLRMLNLEDKDLSTFCKGDAVMEKYEEEVNRVNEEEKYVHFLTDEEEAAMFKRSEIAFAEEKGINKGIAKGKKEGKKEGKQEGLIQTARNMLKDKLPLENISKYTGLSIDEINNLK